MRARRLSPRSVVGPAAGLATGLLVGCSQPAGLGQGADEVSPAPFSAAVAHEAAPFGAPTFTWLGGAAQGARPEIAARATLQRLARSQGLGEASLRTAALRAVHDTGSGPIVAQFEQRVDGVEVFQAGLSITMGRDLRPVAATGTLAKVVRPKSRDFGQDARPAVAAAAAALSGVDPGPGAVIDAGDGGAGYRRYALPTADMTARARRVWFPEPGGLLPAHYVEIEAGAGTSTDSRAEAFVVSQSGEVLFRHNLISADAYSYRVWADRDGRFAPWDSPQGTDYTPHPTGTRDGKVPSLKPQNLVTLESLPFSRKDPWLPPRATQLRGNNVFAYADIAAPDGFGAGDISPTPTGPGAFDRVYDPSTPPQGSPEARQAITTHLFYVLNFMHDYFYDAGWDEKSFNPQQDNFGRGGLGNDPIKGEAQDYGGRNNANAYTPADGASPRIQMYLWSTSLGRKLTIASPLDVAGDYEVVSATFGPGTFDLSGELAVVEDTTAPTWDGCEVPFRNAAALAGKIVLIERGLCQFGQKAANAQQAGAKGVIIVNNAMGLPPNPLGGTPPLPITIPVLGISQADGAKLRAKIEAMGGPVSGVMASNPLDRDGSLDTTIVSHEWGHILSNRLVGNGSGLSSLQGGGMGEGWSDFVALLTIVRPEDVTMPGGAGWAGVYPVGAHAASSGAAAYEGIRRYPYSIDKSKNPLTFKHIQAGVALPMTPAPAFGADGAQNHEVHNTGEVWAAMLWECYAALLKDGRYTFEQANRRMREYLVAGLKLTPRAPTILEARDAILAAAFATEPKDHQVLWQAFARRGAGTGAMGPDRSSRDNKPVVESFIVGSDLAFLRAEADDSAMGCDGDGVLDNGETGKLTVHIRNIGAIPLTGASVTAKTDATSVRFPDGATATFPRIEPNTSGFVALKIALKDARPMEQIAFTFDLKDPMLAVPRVIQAEARITVHYDDVPESSSTDDVNAKTTVWTAAGDMMLDGSRKWDRVFEGPNGRWHIDDNESPSDQYLVSPALQVGDAPFSFRFKHRWRFEAQLGENQDGGVVELSEDGGMSWIDLGGKMTAGGYTGLIYGENPVLKGRRAFTASSAGYPMSWTTTTVELGEAYKGKSVLVRFRMGTDEGTGAPGWDVDDIAFVGLKKPPFPSRVPHRASCQNRPPMAHAGQDQTVAPGAEVTLQGSGTDPDNDPLTFRWTQSAGQMVSLGDGKTARVTFKAPDSPDLKDPVELAFTLVVNDGAVDSAPATVRVIVDPKLKPGPGPGPGPDPMMPPDPNNPDPNSMNPDDQGCSCKVGGRRDFHAAPGLGLLMGLGAVLGLLRRRQRRP